MKNHNRRPWWALLVAICHACIGLSAMALPEDKQQPIYISSDRAQRDHQKNMTLYEGDVELVQGSLKILADKITIYHRGKDVSRIIAVGKPARYQQQPSVDKGTIVAKADTITYESQKRHILLQGNASIDQNGAILTGEAIDYNIEAAVMKAMSDMRIQMVIPANGNEHSDK